MNTLKYLRILLIVMVLASSGLLIRAAPAAFAAPPLDGGGGPSPTPTETETPVPTDTPSPLQVPTSAAAPQTTPPYPVAEDIAPAPAETAEVSATGTSSMLGFLLCAGVLVVAGLAALNIWSRRNP